MDRTQPKLFRQTKLKGGYAPAQEFETRQLFAESKDGTRVPMFITHKKGTPLDGSAPTLLYGYGGKAGPCLIQCSAWQHGQLCCVQCVQLIIVDVASLVMLCRV